VTPSQDCRPVDVLDGAAPSSAYRLNVTVAGADAVGLATILGDVGVALTVRRLTFRGTTDEFVVTVRREPDVLRLRAGLTSRLGDRLLSCVDPVLAQAGTSKIRVRAAVPLETASDLAVAYTPGVGRLATLIAADPAEASELTGRGNRVAVVSDGSAVLGLGALGPYAALPVMEGKAALFARLADIDAVPLCLDVHDVDSIVAVVTALAPSFGGINLEDIAAPICFEVERRLITRLDIPVFHDDQHGTAIVVLAGLMNALRRVVRVLSTERIVVVGAGAAGTAVTRLLLSAGARNVVVCTPLGILCADDAARLPEHQAWLALHTNPGRVAGGLPEALAGAQTVIGLSRAGVLSRELIAAMSTNPIVFALANPVPEIEPSLIADIAAVVATGSSDDVCQVNNVLAFPGVFRGLLDARARHVSTGMKLSAARALAGLVDAEEASRILPDVFDPRVVPAVAAAMNATMGRRRPGDSNPPNGTSGGARTDDVVPGRGKLG
jgi:malate dehydrogenase (oxaloacetate-decarboxylating)